MITTVLVFSVLLVGNLERPHLTLAQGYEESRLNTKAVGRAGEKGAWQVREKYWGKVPRSLGDQARHAEEILNKIQKEKRCNLMTALARYNGLGHQSRAYARRVRRSALELAMVVFPETSKIDMRGYVYGSL